MEQRSSDQTAANEAIERLEACFKAIERTRMSGVPILNPALAVKSVGCEPWNGEWLTVLVTPWFINLMLLPASGTRDPQSAAHIGKKDLVQFPAGPFEFIRGFEDDIGPFRLCSLFSPVLDFADQATAEEAANAALALLFETQDPKDPEIDRDMQAIWRGERPRVAAAAQAGEAQASGVAISAATEAPAPSTVSNEDEDQRALSRRSLLFFGRDRGVEER